MEHEILTEEFLTKVRNYIKNNDDILNNKFESIYRVMCSLSQSIGTVIPIISDQINSHLNSISYVLFNTDSHYPAINVFRGEGKVGKYIQNFIDLNNAYDLVDKILVDENTVCKKINNERIQIEFDDIFKYNPVPDTNLEYSTITSIVDNIFNFFKSTEFHTKNKEFIINIERQSYQDKIIRPEEVTTDGIYKISNGDYYVCLIVNYDNIKSVIVINLHNYPSFIIYYFHIGENKWYIAHNFFIEGFPTKLLECSSKFINTGFKHFNNDFDISELKDNINKIILNKSFINDIIKDKYIINNHHNLIDELWFYIGKKNVKISNNDGIIRININEPIINEYKNQINCSIEFHYTDSFKIYNCFNAIIDYYMYVINNRIKEILTDIKSINNESENITFDGIVDKLNE